jgi:signal peptidase II
MESEAEPKLPAGPLDQDSAGHVEPGSASSTDGAPPPPPAPEPSLPREAGPPAPSSPERPPSIVFLVVLTTLSLAADLVTKAWAKHTLSGFDQKLKAARKITLIKDHLDLIFAQNPGGAWSFLRGLPDTLRRPFFLVVSAAAIVFIVSMYQRLHPDQRAMKWGLPLALGGAMGNLVDRIRYGWVIDFVDAYLVRGGREHHWPTFNVADIAIVIGVGLMAISMLFSARGPHNAADLKGAPSSAAVPPAA